MSSLASQIDLLLGAQVSDDQQDSCFSPTLPRACHQSGSEHKRIVARMTPIRDETKHSWTPRNRSLPELITELAQHNDTTRELLRDLSLLFSTILEDHGEEYPGLERAAAVFNVLFDELHPYLAKEEEVVFPKLLRLQNALVTGAFASVNNIQSTFRIMTVEHAAVEDLMLDLREITTNYSIPQGRCPAHDLLCNVLSRLESDLRRHFDCEDRILFPQAVALDARTASNA